MNAAPLDPDSLALDHVTLAWLKARLALNLPPVWEIPLHDLRAGLEMAQAQLADKPRALSDDLDLPVGPSGKLSVRLLRPSGVPGKRPVVVYLHGGGWVVGSPDTHDRLCRDLVNASGAALVVPRYSRSPEARYPQALEEAYAACVWLAEHGEALGLDGSRLAVAGDSAGATLAAGVCLLAKRRGGPAIRHQTLLYPVTDASMSRPSVAAMASGLNLTRAAMQWYWEQYAPDPADRRSDTASPIEASPEDLAGLPPALVITAEYDPLRDEGEDYARNLARAGVAVTAARYLGALHGFAAQNPLAATPPTLAAVAQMGQAMREHLKP